MAAKTKKILTAAIAVAVIAIVVVLIVFLAQKNGFVFEGDDVYYYKNGDMVVGWTIIEDERYYFDADGTMHKGWLEQNGDLYYFRKGAGNGDIGGDLLISEEATMTDLDGVYWWVRFGKNGKLEEYNYNYEKYAAENKEVPFGTEPKFQ